ncbi:MAG: FeoB-associated Cys-rich membrane protein [Coriobacteriaceae bacterium]|nr:FeoB-associated Cys-rich membrane protein [Coriobacteriaceae bacterium]
MNLASWVILGIVLLAVVLAIRATFFKKSKGGCCDVGDSQGGCSASGCAGCSCSSCSAVKLPDLPDTK